ncbi:hypothetical protein LVD15_19080 [Fulvivirga maritima]|uniref:hypothetical protein n=1 Tax=Fulvivirga maritima TaxID=2904247 RepID=UPI001F431CE1|nr:hypothetical protein [Fulvivirga maritima]UII25390.1 hypothetical protein LVD15_19080 [Fulvivirga maritima]
MAKYYVNITKSHTSPGKHDVHEERCPYTPPHTVFLGFFNNCEMAVFQATKFYSDVEACTICCTGCSKNKEELMATEKAS